MNLVNALKKRLTNQFISVIVYTESCNIKQKIIKNSKLIHKEEFNFDIESRDNLGSKVVEFLNSLQDKYENSYIALFLNTSSQGVIPGCDESRLESFNIDKKSVKTICKDGRFLMYSTWIDIKWADKLFAKTGVFDFGFFYFNIYEKGELQSQRGCFIYIAYQKRYNFDDYDRGETFVWLFFQYGQRG